MNLQIQLGSASDTSVSISLNSQNTLSIPVGSAIIIISSSPSCTIFSATISRFSLPPHTTRNRAKDVLLISAWQPLKGHSALFASKYFSWFELWVLCATRGYNCAMESLALLRAIRIFQDASGKFTGYSLTAVRTLLGHYCFACFIPTFHRTEFLISMISWCDKVISTPFTRDRLVKATRFIRARDRAEMVYSIFSFWNRLAATFTIDGFHSTIIQTNDGGV